MVPKKRTKKMGSGIKEDYAKKEKYNKIREKRTKISRR